MKIAFDRETAYDEVVLHADAWLALAVKVPRGFVRIRPQPANLNQTDVLPVKVNPGRMFQVSWRTDHPHDEPSGALASMRGGLSVWGRYHSLLALLGPLFATTALVRVRH